MTTRILTVLLLLIVTTAALSHATQHADYVPDEKTAERIAEAVLVARFGQSRVDAQRPLHAASMSKDQWLVQGTIEDKQGRPQIGGGFGVWINKHNGCLSVIERMK